MKKRLLILDNYDSFTYNLVQLVREADLVDITVCRNDEASVEDLKDYDAFLFSPGPGLPKDSGILCDLIRRYATTHPMLGVCLGMQAIAEVHGARLYNLATPLHGVATPIHLDKDTLFENIESPTTVGRYHSWAVSEDGLQSDWNITARDENGVPMAMSHEELPISAVQFHPESILSNEGKKMITNFLKRL